MAVPRTRQTATRSRAGTASGTAAPRELFLDVIRGLALLRVIVWHAFGVAAITYVVAAVPAMFFVTGSLLAKSLDRRGGPTVLLDRGRRILMPMWAFAAVAFGAMGIAHAVSGSASTRVPWRSLPFWLFPLGDPKGNAWEGGWMSSPLWYLRALLWLIVLSPLLLAAVRRARTVAFAVPLAVVFGLDWIGRNPRWTFHPAPMLPWQIGDLALYAIFLMAGFLHRDRVFATVSRRGWLAGGAGCAVAAAAWITTQPVPLHVVNNSHPAHLFVGAAWLCAAMAAERALTRLASLPVARTVVPWITQRTMTIYLWHTTGVILTFEVLSRHGPLPTGAYSVAILAGTACITLLFVVLFGWLEDLASRRPPRLCPLVLDRADPSVRPSMFTRHRRRVRRIVGAPALVGLLLLGTVAVSTGAPTLAAARGQGVSAAATSASGAVRSKRPPVPSQAPPKAVFEPVTAPAVTTPHAAIASGPAGGTNLLPSVLAPAADPTFAAQLQSTLERWMAEWNVPGAQVGLLRAGSVEWAGAAGIDPYTNAPTAPGDTFDMDSITKTFTAVLVFQQVDAGTITLDEPLPALARVPMFPYAGAITIRQLLTHQSGLRNYRDTTEWTANPDAIDSPETAIMASGADPLDFAPGTAYAYSSTNYLLLGLLLEQVTGRSYDQLLHDQVLAPLGLTSITHLGSGPQTPNFATGGLVTDLDALLRWAVALYRERLVISPANFAVMQQIDPGTSLGAGSMGYCPCTVDLEGGNHFAFIGHSGGRTILQYSDADDLAIVINVTDSLWLDDRGRAVGDLTQQLRALVAAHASPVADAAAPARPAG